MRKTNASSRISRLATIGHGVEVRDSQIPRAGRGLYAQRKFDKGEWITRYGGKMISKEEADAIRKNDPTRTSHMRALDHNNFILDAHDLLPEDGVPGASFANDARGSDFKNNSRFSTVLYGPDNLHIAVVLIATDVITKSEEIFCSYGTLYWDYVEYARNLEKENTKAISALVDIIDLTNIGDDEGDDGNDDNNNNNNNNKLSPRHATKSPQIGSSVVSVEMDPQIFGSEDDGITMMPADYGIDASEKGAFSENPQVFSDNDLLSGITPYQEMLSMSQLEEIYQPDEQAERVQSEPVQSEPVLIEPIQSDVIPRKIRVAEEEDLSALDCMRLIYAYIYSKGIIGSTSVKWTILIRDPDAWNNVLKRIFYAKKSHHLLNDSVKSQGPLLSGIQDQDQVKLDDAQGYIDSFPSEEQFTPRTEISDVLRRYELFLAHTIIKITESVDSQGSGSDPVFHACMDSLLALENVHQRSVPDSDQIHVFSYSVMLLRLVHHYVLSWMNDHHWQGTVDATNIRHPAFRLDLFLPSLKMNDAKKYATMDTAEWMRLMLSFVKIVASHRFGYANRSVTLETESFVLIEQLLDSTSWDIHQYVTAATITLTVLKRIKTDNWNVPMPLSKKHIYKGVFGETSHLLPEMPMGPLYRQLTSDDYLKMSRRLAYYTKFTDSLSLVMKKYLVTSENTPFNIYFVGLGTPVLLYRSLDVVASVRNTTNRKIRLIMIDDNHVAHRMFRDSIQTVTLPPNVDLMLVKKAAMDRSTYRLLSKETGNMNAHVVLVDLMGPLGDDQMINTVADSMVDVTDAKTRWIPKKIQTWVAPFSYSAITSLLQSDIENREKIWELNIKEVGSDKLKKIQIAPAQWIYSYDLSGTRKGSRNDEWHSNTPFIIEGKSKKNKHGCILSGFLSFSTALFWDKSRFASNQFACVPMKRSVRVIPGDKIEFEMHKKFSAQTKIYRAFANREDSVRTFYYEWRVYVYSQRANPANKRAEDILKKTNRWDDAPDIPENLYFQSTMHNENGSVQQFAAYLVDTEKSTPPTVSTSKFSPRKDIYHGRSPEEEASLEVKDSLIAGAGKGLFAKVPITMDDPHIGYYTGDLLTNDQRLAKYGDHLAPYIVEITGDLYIDAISPESGLCRYINDPRGSNFVANARFVPIPHKRTVRVEATRHIAPGEEIFVKYRQDYWNSKRRDEKRKVDDQIVPKMVENGLDLDSTAMEYVAIPLLLNEKKRDEEYEQDYSSDNYNDAQEEEYEKPGSFSEKSEKISEKRSNFSDDADTAALENRSNTTANSDDRIPIVPYPSDRKAIEAKRKVPWKLMGKYAFLMDIIRGLLTDSDRMAIISGEEAMAYASGRRGSEMDLIRELNEATETLASDGRPNPKKYAASASVTSFLLDAVTFGLKKLGIKDALMDSIRSCKRKLVNMYGVLSVMNETMSGASNLEELMRELDQAVSIVWRFAYRIKRTDVLSTSHHEYASFTGLIDLSRKEMEMYEEEANRFNREVASHILEIPISTEIGASTETAIDLTFGESHRPDVPHLPLDQNCNFGGAHKIDASANDSIASMNRENLSEKTQFRSETSFRITLKIFKVLHVFSQGDRFQLEVYIPLRSTSSPMNALFDLGEGQPSGYTPYRTLHNIGGTSGLDVTLEAPLPDPPSCGHSPITVVGLRLYRLIRPVTDTGKVISTERKEPVCDFLLDWEQLGDAGKMGTYTMKDTAWPREDRPTAQVELAIVLNDRPALEHDGKLRAAFNPHESSLQQLIDTFYQMVVNNDSELQPSLYGIRDIHVPYYATSSSLLPASTFACELPPLGEVPGLLRKLEGCLLAVMDYNNMVGGAASFLEHYRAYTHGPKTSSVRKQLLKTVIDAINLLANICDYRTDLRATNAKECERFIDAFMTEMGDCVAEYEEIYTEEGKPKAIKDVEPGERILSYNFERSQYEYKKIVSKTDKGVLPTVRVTFNNGTHIDVTEDHPMWSRRNQLGKGIYTKTPLSEIDLKNAYKRKVPIAVKIPYLVEDVQWLTEDHCFLIGHFLAEGCTDKYHTETSGYDIPEHIVPRVETLHIPYSLRKNGNGVPILRYLKSPFKDYLREMLRNSFDFEIPEEMMNLPEEKLQAVMDGYFLGDGHYHRQNGVIEKIYSTSCEAFAVQMHEISLKLGNPLYIYKQENHGGLGKKPIYRLHDNPNSYAKKNYGHDGISETSIKKIEPIGDIRVYDIEVEDTHTFVFKNGILGHNCEDLIKMSYVCGMTLKQYGREYKGGSSAECTEMVVKASELLQDYLFFIVVGSSVTFKMTGENVDPDCDPQRKFACHIYGMCAHKSNFARIYGGPESTLPKDWSIPSQHQPTETFAWIMEGTNFSHPCQLPLNMMHSHEADEISSLDFIQQGSAETLELKYDLLRTMATQGQQPRIRTKTYAELPPECLSDFYRRPVTLWTREFIDRGIPITDLTICNRDRTVYGVDFKDMVLLKEDKVSIVPTFYYDAASLQAVDQVLKQQPPILCGGRASYAFLREHRLDNLKQKYPVPERENTYYKNIVVPRYTSFRINHTDRLTDDLVALLDTILEKQDLGYYGFDYTYFTPDSSQPDFCYIEIKLYHHNTTSEQIINNLKEVQSQLG
jgi:intein/homing endonuclease